MRVLSAAAISELREPSTGSSNNCTGHLSSSDSPGCGGGALLHLSPLLQACCSSSGELLVSSACPNQHVPIAVSPECVSRLVQGETTI